MRGVCVGGKNCTRCQTCGVRPDIGSTTSVPEFWLRKNSEPSLKLLRESLFRNHKVEEVSCRGNSLRKQVTEAKEGPLELRRKTRKTCLRHAWGKGVGKGLGVLRRESRAGPLS